MFQKEFCKKLIRISQIGRFSATPEPKLLFSWKKINANHFKLSKLKN